MKNRIIKNPTTEQALDCIQHNFFSWKENRQNAFIYISFSYGILYKTHSQNNMHLRANIEEFKSFQLSKRRIAEYKTLLQEQWIKPTGLPVKFADDENLTSKDALNKNIVFIVGKNHNPTRHKEVLGCIPMNIIIHLV